MKNKLNEMYCVSCSNYYSLKDDEEPVLLRKGEPPKELGGKKSKPEEKKSVPQPQPQHQFQPPLAPPQKEEDIFATLPTSILKHPEESSLNQSRIKLLETLFFVIARAKAIIL